MSDDYASGLTPAHELFFDRCPDDPEMRESTSFWLFEETGAFALPRFGIEAEATSWDNRRVQGNFALSGGTILNGASMSESAHSPFAADGTPRILGAGPVSFECIEPFRRWRTRWNGPVVMGSIADQIHHRLDPNNRADLSFDITLNMGAPCWVHDFSPERLPSLPPEVQEEAAYMGIGWRLEQLCRGEGTWTLNGETRTFTCVGSRIKRQSVRPLMGFRGHCWQSALFPDGRGFGFIAYPPHADGRPGFADGYIVQDGRMVPAKPVTIPWLSQIKPEGDDVTLELESALGRTVIKGATTLSTFRVNNPDLPGLHLQQGGVWYEWDGQRAMGMIERSLAADHVAIAV